jgi:uncharacterized membrane protein
MSNPMSLATAALLGLALLIALLVAVIIGAGLDAVSLVSLVARVVHVLAAAVWIGLIVFMNAIHIPAIDGASDPERAAFLRWYVPKLGAAMGHAATLTVVMGVILLVTVGYALGSAVYGTPVYVPPLRHALIGLGMLGGLVMLGLVHGVIRPGFRRILDPATAPADRATLRERVKAVARINLALALPVVFAMIAAAHG